MNSLVKRFPRYSKLLALFPAGYRKEYDEQMLQMLADMLDDPERSRAAVWLRTIVDFPISLTWQRVTHGVASAREMPPYIRHNSLTGLWLIAPFFVLVILNNLTNQRLHHSIFWTPSILFTWLISFPSIAILLNVAALLRWIQNHRRETGKSVWKTVTDFRHNWPLVSVIVLGLAILAIVFGHDSVQCIGGNPFQELTHHRQTIQCLERN